MSGQTTVAAAAVSAANITFTETAPTITVTGDLSENISVELDSVSVTVSSVPLTETITITL